MVIKKKQFMGDKTLRSYVIPRDVEEIGDWAFARCRELTNVWIPEGVKRIGRNVFDGCEKLSCVSWYQKSADEEDELGNLMAIAFRFFDFDERMVTLRAVSREAWLSYWDERCLHFLEEADEKGFRPFLAGGEEDYEDDGKEREAYRNCMRLRKANAIVWRLLIAKEDKSHYLKLLGENDAATELLKEEIYPWKKAVRIFEEAGLFTQENVRRLLKELPEDRMELRSLLMQEAVQTDPWTL